MQNAGTFPPSPLETPHGKHSNRTTHSGISDRLGVRRLQSAFLGACLKIPARRIILVLMLILTGLNYLTMRTRMSMRHGLWIFRQHLIGIHAVEVGPRNAETRERKDTPRKLRTFTPHDLVNLSDQKKL